HIRVDGRPLIDTDYSQGEGHCPSAKSGLKRGTLDYESAIGFEVETGKPYGDMFRTKKIPAPDLASVFGSLVQDAQGVLDAGSFESWASDLGYDTDSRRAESIYNQCRDNAVKIVGFIG